MPLGQAVEAEEHVVGPLPVQHRRSDRRQGSDESRVVVEGRQDRDRRHHVVPGQLGEDRLQRGPGRRGGVLRIERRHHEPRRPAGPQSIERLRDGRPAVAHGQLDEVVGSQRRADAGLQLPGEGEERRALGAPDLGVGGGALPRPGREDHELEEQLPRHRVDVDDPRVGEELAQVAAHRGRGGRLGRAEVEEEDSVHPLRLPGGSPGRQRSTRASFSARLSLFRAASRRRAPPRSRARDDQASSTGRRQRV